MIPQRPSLPTTSIVTKRFIAEIDTKGKTNTVSVVAESLGVAFNMAADEATKTDGTLTAIFLQDRRVWSRR